MQGRARGRKGERNTYHINPYHHITMEFGGYLLNVAKTPQGVLSYQKATGIFNNPHMDKRLTFLQYFLITSFCDYASSKALCHEKSESCEHCDLGYGFPLFPSSCFRHPWKQDEHILFDDLMTSFWGRPKLIFFNWVGFHSGLDRGLTEDAAFLQGRAHMPHIERAAAPPKNRNSWAKTVSGLDTWSIECRNLMKFACCSCPREAVPLQVIFSSLIRSIFVHSC